MKKRLAFLLALCLMLPAGALAVNVTARDFIAGQYVPFILEAVDSYGYVISRPGDDPEQPDVRIYWFGKDADGGIVASMLDSAANYAEYAANCVRYELEGDSGLRTATLYDPEAYSAYLASRCLQLATLFPGGTGELWFEEASDDALTAAFAYEEDGADCRLLMSLQKDTFALMQYELYQKDGADYRLSTSVRAQINPTFTLPEPLEEFVGAPGRTVILHYADDLSLELTAPADAALLVRDLDGYRTLYTDAARTEAFGYYLSGDSSAPLDLYVGDSFPSEPAE